MKVLNSAQIREWDLYTIQHEPVASIELMERAAIACVQWLEEHLFADHVFAVFCGKGNNGGDGLAIARMLLERDCRVDVYILEFGHLGTADFQENLKRLHHLPQSAIHFVQGEQQFPAFSTGTVIIDALFGSGLNRPLSGVSEALVKHLNNSGCTVVSIDVPSGLPVDQPASGEVIRAAFTLTFQVYKLGLLLQENGPFIGQVVVLNIGLSPEFYDGLDTHYETVDAEMITAIYKPRKPFAHKGNYGHALLVAGSYGKMGAAVLCTTACVRAGAGLTSCHIPACGYATMQTAIPEAMVFGDDEEKVISAITEDVSKFSVAGIGPGMGTDAKTISAFRALLPKLSGPAVIDADGLNILSKDLSLLEKIPPGSVLTPHPGEFQRLFGKSANEFDRLETAAAMAAKYQCVVVLKGHHTCIITPGGRFYFNNTGNAGLAKGGSGDVLTGIIVAMLAQGYEPVAAAILGVYLHGLAADFGAQKKSEEALTASDIIDHIGEGFLTIRGDGLNTVIF